MTNDPDNVGASERRAQPALPLEYRSAVADRRDRVSSAGPLVGGALMSLVAGPAAVALGILLSIHQSSAPFWWVVGLTAGFLNLIAIVTYRSDSPRQRSLATGIWVGLGLAVLIEGVCFISLSR